MTVASRLSTTGMDVGVLVGVAVGTLSVGVNVSVRGARVGTGVSVGMTMFGATVEVAGAETSTVAEEGSVQAVSRKVKVREVVRKFFISVYISIL